MSLWKLYSPRSASVGITETVLAEVIADPDEAERRSLLKLLDRLLHPGNCIMPFQWIIEHQAKAYEQDKDGYEWRGLNVRFFGGEQEIFRQEIIHELSEETRAGNKRWDKEFRAIFSTAKPAFQKLFGGGEERPSLQAVTEHLMQAIIGLLGGDQPNRAPLCAQSVALATLGGCYYRPARNLLWLCLAGVSVTERRRRLCGPLSAWWAT